MREGRTYRGRIVDPATELADQGACDRGVERSTDGGVGEQRRRFGTELVVGERNQGRPRDGVVVVAQQLEQRLTRAWVELVAQAAGGLHAHAEVRVIDVGE